MRIGSGRKCSLASTVGGKDAAIELPGMGLWPVDDRVGSCLNRMGRRGAFSRDYRLLALLLLAPRGDGLCLQQEWARSAMR